MNVAAGQTIAQNVNLTPDAIKMDAYVVGASKAMEQDMIAINEQRFAPNMKTVVSTGDLSEHVDGNIAEFLKFVPGVSTDDSRPGGSALSIRGFPDEFTEVTQNGAAVANAALNNTSRSVATRMTRSITNIAGGVQGSFGPDYTIGGTGRRSVSFPNNSQEQNYGGSRGNIRYSFDNGPWKIDLQSSIAAANTWVRTVPKSGTIRNMSVATTVPLRVEFYDIDPFWGPGEIRVFDNANQRIDPTSPGIHNLTAVSLANVYSSDSYSDVDTYNVDVRRKFDRFPIAIQAGGARKVRDQDKDIRLQYYTDRGGAANSRGTTRPISRASCPRARTGVSICPETFRRRDEMELSQRSKRWRRDQPWSQWI